jgi:hypothetical protein
MAGFESPTAYMRNDSGSDEPPPKKAPKRRIARSGATLGSFMRYRLQLARIVNVEYCTIIEKP